MVEGQAEAVAFPSRRGRRRAMPASSRRQERPRSARRRAAAIPAQPAPMTSMSGSEGNIAASCRGFVKGEP